MRVVRVQSGRGQFILFQTEHDVFAPVRLGGALRRGSGILTIDQMGSNGQVLYPEETIQKPKGCCVYLFHAHQLLWSVGCRDVCTIKRTKGMIGNDITNTNQTHLFS